MTATDTGKPDADEAPAGPVIASRTLISRRVIWLGLAAGTAITVLAVRHGVRFPDLTAAPSWWTVALSVAITWLLLILVAVTVTELLRRHHRALAGHAVRHGKRGALFTARQAGRGGRAVTAKAAERWQRRHHPEPADKAPQTFPVMLSARSKSGRPLDPVTREPVTQVLVRGQNELDQRLPSLADYPDIEVTVRPIDQDGDAVTSPAEGKTAMSDTVIRDDDAEADINRRSRARHRVTARAASPGIYSAEWKAIASRTADFEPEDDSHLLEWMAAEVNGLSGYAEAVTEVYETCVNSVGLDPVSMAATHDFADAVAEAASAMAAARAKFAAHYAEVREFAASGGLLPYQGRWITGDGEA